MSIVKKYITQILLLLILSITIIIDIDAQHLPKYENLYKDAFDANNKTYAYTLFSEFLIQNPESKRASAYFNLGTLAFDISQNYDLIANHANYMEYAAISDSCLKLCLKHLNDDEVARDNIMFQNVQSAGTKLTYAEVYDYVDQMIEKNKAQMRNARKLYHVYQGLTANYSACQNIYKYMCDHHTTEKEIYLMLDVNIDVLKILENMIELSDSIDYYLDEYQGLLEKSDDNIEIEKAKILIYRVDGLSIPNFRTSKITVWDYKAWAHRCITDIDAFAFIFQDVINASAQLTRRINMFNTNRSLSDNYFGYEVDRDVMDSLNYYAYFPALNSYITYKEDKLNFLTRSRRRINSPDFDNNGTLTLKDKLYYYDNLLKEYKNLEFLRKELEKYAISGNRTDFGSMNFIDDEKSKIFARDEFKEYVQDEFTENEFEIKTAFENLKQYFLKVENNLRRTKYVTYHKQEIPLFFANGFYRSSNPQSFVTKCIEPSVSGIYLGGSTISKEGFAIAYIALCSPDSLNILWYKTVDIGRVMYDNSVTALYPTFDGGCFVLIVAKNVSDPALLSSTIIQYNAKGAEIKRLTLPEKTLGIGRHISYDAVSEQMLMAFYGNEEFWFTPQSRLMLQKINLNNNILMSAELQMSGSLVEILPAKDSSLLVIGNYFSIVDENDIEYKLQSQGVNHQSGIFSALFSSKGKLLKLNRYNIRDSGYAVAAVKIDNNAISVLGQKGYARPDDTVPFVPGDLIYMTIDAEGNLLFTNQQ